MIVACEAESLRTPICDVSTGPWRESVPTLAGAAIRIFTRAQEFRIDRVFEHPRQRLVIVRIVLQHTDFLLAVVHLSSKVYATIEHQIVESVLAASQLRDVERRFGHRRTLAIGDFNMNPFEAGMVSAAGFHAVMTKSIAFERSRRVQGEDYPFFYNPMWGLFGDRTPGPPGTFYFRNADQFAIFHQMLDQVLLRPDLLSSTPEIVRIIKHCGDQALADERGRPLAEFGSDHLPILVRLAVSSDPGIS